MKPQRFVLVFVSLLVLLVVGIGQAEVLPPGGGSGAIFTTTPDGSIVNENVHYAGRHYVYLDGGPKQNAPSTAAGLDEGFYVFQITDPPGKILLSRDPARCRIVHVNAEGVIDQLMPPTDNSVTDPDGNTVVLYTGASTDNWEDNGNGNSFKDEPCHVQEDPDGEPGTFAPTPDITGVGRHDTNTDVDHGLDKGAIVVQMMPYGLTPNPGGVYKAWMTPIQAYVDVKSANLNDVPNQLPKGKQKPHECFDFCAPADPGFVPSNRYTKTDNFKVTEFFPPEIKVRKFHDLDGDGIWDDGEPEIGVDQCVFADGTLEETCDEGGGWPYDFTYPIDGMTMTDGFFTPHTHLAGVAGTYTAEEEHLSGWIQTAAYLDGDFVYDNGDPAKAVSVDVFGLEPGETHEIIFGNFMLVDVTACKYRDFDGDGDADEPIEGWEVYLTIDGAIEDTQYTESDGCYTWEDLDPLAEGSYYDVEEDVPEGWTPTSDTSHDFESPPQSGASYTFTFTNFENVDVEACKYEDKTGDGLTEDDTPIEGWTVYLTETGVRKDTQTTGSDGCYKWTDLGPLPEGYYDVEEDVPEGWTPTSDTSHDFESPPQSGASYTFTFTNFENVDVTACKLKDADGDISTTGDQTPKGGWNVYLTESGEVIDEGVTDYETGCFTWENLPPLEADGYYDVEEEERPGWIALGAYNNDGVFIPYATGIDFETPPQSGASYTAVFVNTPTQGCTPGYWKQEHHFDSWVGYAPGDLLVGLFAEVGFDPYDSHVAKLEDQYPDVQMGIATLVEALRFAGGGDTVPEKAEILLRAAVAAVLNTANPDVQYQFDDVNDIIDLVNDALASQDPLAIIDLAGDFDMYNNAPGGCPLN